ncbi:MAG: hypothetical protein AAFO70_06265, partial [Pseudomonadota bacterium]
MGIALLTAVVTYAFAVLGLWSQNWALDGHLLGAVWPYAPAGGLAGLAATWVAPRISKPTRRFALTAFTIAAVAIGVLAAIYALQYRIYFSQWHAASFSITWIYQTIFTTLGSIYLFLSTGLVLLV